jgi:DNA invertase Pin-like site-specific DNA recombinase
VGGFTELTGINLGFNRLTALPETLGNLSALTHLDAQGNQLAALAASEPVKPSLDQALAAVRVGDTLVVPKLDRLARSVPDARDIGDAFSPAASTSPSAAASTTPADPMSKMFFNMLAVFAEF